MRFTGPRMGVMPRMKGLMLKGGGVSRLGERAMKAVGDELLFEPEGGGCNSDDEFVPIKCDDEPVPIIPLKPEKGGAKTP